MFFQLTVPEGSFRITVHFLAWRRRHGCLISYEPRIQRERFGVTQGLTALLLPLLLERKREELVRAVGPLSDPQVERGQGLVLVCGAELHSRAARRWAPSSPPPFPSGGRATVQLGAPAVAPRCKDVNLCACLHLVTWSFVCIVGDGMVDCSLLVRRGLGKVSRSLSVMGSDGRACCRAVAWSTWSEHFCSRTLGSQVLQHV